MQKLEFKLQGSALEKSVSLLSLLPALGILGLCATGIWFLGGCIQTYVPLLKLTPFKLTLLSLVIGLLPLLCSLLASFVAGRLGISLSEAQVDDYFIGAFNLGPKLYSLFVFGWFAMFTLPLGFIGLVTSAIWAGLKST